MNIDQIIDSLKSNNSFMKNVTKWETVPPKKGSYSSIPADISDKLKHALSESGIFELYKHQAEAISFVRAGRNTVIVTPTASGKTLCYNIPVMDQSGMSEMLS